MTFACLALHGAAVSNLQELIARFEEANGGADNIASVQTLRVKAEVEDGGNVLELILIKKRPNSARLSITVDEVNRITAGQDGRVWASLKGPGGFAADWLDYDNAKAFYISMLFESYLLRKQGKDYQLEFIGLTSFEGINAYEVKVTSKHEGTFSIFIESNDFFEVGKRTSTRLGLVEVSKITINKDFKRLNGIWVAQLIESYEEGVKLETTRITEIKINVGAPSFLFEPPADLAEKSPNPPYTIDYYQKEADTEEGDYNEGTEVPGARDASSQ